MGTHKTGMERISSEARIASKLRFFGPACAAASTPREPRTVDRERNNSYGSTMNIARFEEARLRMVERQLVGRGIRDPRVLAAMARVPRHEFVPLEYLEQAYADGPIPIGYDQTISQPFVVAYMAELLELKPDDRILEIGTGSGYNAAVLGELVQEVLSVEIVRPLFLESKNRLERLGYKNIHLRCGDGHGGWPEEAPFEGIVLTASPEEVPKPLFDQLNVGRSLVAPTGPRHNQELLRYRRGPDGWTEQRLGLVAFVPMTKEP